MALRWRKSTHSDGSGQCVEVAAHPDGRVMVRDSKRPGPELAMTARTWTALLSAVEAGRRPAG